MPDSGEHHAATQVEERRLPSVLMDAIAVNTESMYEALGVRVHDRKHIAAVAVHVLEIMQCAVLAPIHTLNWCVVC
jgi:hypothetical protein